MADSINLSKSRLDTFWLLHDFVYDYRAQPLVLHREVQEIKFPYDELFMVMPLVSLYSLVIAGKDAFKPASDDHHLFDLTQSFNVFKFKHVLHFLQYYANPVPCISGVSMTAEEAEFVL